MARARFIRPEFFTDAKVCRMPVHARLLFERTWVNADLRGVFVWDADQFKADAFPFDNDVCPAQVRHWFDLCQAQGLVVRFVAPDESGVVREWGWIPNFQKHQPITSSERKWGTKYPSPPARLVPGTSQTHAHTLTLTPALTPAPAPAQPPGGEGVFDPADKPSTPVHPPAPKPVRGADLFMVHRGQIRCFGKDQGIACLDACLELHDHQAVTAAIKAEFAKRGEPIPADELAAVCRDHAQATKPKPAYDESQFYKPMIDIDTFRREGRMTPAKDRA